MQRIREHLEGTLIVWLTISCGFAWWVNQSLAGGAATISLLSTQTVIPAIQLAMFCIGCLLPADEFWQVLKQGKSVIGGCCTQYLCMPLLAWGIASLLQLEGALFQGVILTGAVPGAMASNVLTMTARGNVSYSISLTTLATLVSPFTVPLALYLFLGVNRGPRPEAVFWNLLLTVALPVLLGFGCKLLLPRWINALENVFAVLANSMILWVIALAIGKNGDSLTQVTGLLIAALLLLNGTGYLAGWLAGTAMRLPTGKRRALTLEIGMQNAGVGTSLALSFFPDPATAIPTAVYTFGCMFTGTLLANIWARHSRHTEENPSSEAGEVV